MGVFQCCAAVCQHFASSANVLVLLLPSEALFVCVSLTLAPPCTALHCRVERDREREERKNGDSQPQKTPSMVPLPPSPSLHAGLDELARDKRLCGPAMKGLLTILHPPEALPAGHRLPECHSLSRPQSQHAPLPFSANPCHPRASL